MIGGTPTTPSGMRVRTGQFESLRRHPQSVEVRNGQHPPVFQQPAKPHIPASCAIDVELSHFTHAEVQTVLMIRACVPACSRRR